LKDYKKEFEKLDKMNSKKKLQFDIFDHLIKILESKKLTLKEVFD